MNQNQTRCWTPWKRFGMTVKHNFIHLHNFIRGSSNTVVMQLQRVCYVLYENNLDWVLLLHCTIPMTSSQRTTYLNRKTLPLPEFVDSMKEVIKEQRDEVEKAVASCGEHRVTSGYKHLASDNQKWFKMSEKQRES